MTRRTKLNRQKEAEQTIGELLANIVEDIVKAAEMPHDDWWELSQHPIVPLAIPISNGREYRVTQTGVNAAHKLTSQLWEERQDLRHTISRKAFERLSFQAIGQSIMKAWNALQAEPSEGKLVNEESEFYEKLEPGFRKTLDRLADKVRIDVDQHIPCDLFHTDQSVSAFAVGPVEFRPRSDWIDCFVKNDETHDMIQKVERRESTVDDLRQGALSQDNRAPADALTVINSLRAYSWVGTVRSLGHEFGQSHSKTTILTGLAIDAVGLRFHPEEARRFTMAGRPSLMIEDRLATAIDDGRFIHGWSTHVPGLASAPGELAERMRNERNFLNAAGRILDVYWEQRKKGKAPDLIERWVNALYWVGEARRELFDFMAVVKYGCALDGLTGGGGDTREIRNFVKAALLPNESVKPPRETMSLDDAVEIVYGDGRSILAHGGSPGLLEDFSEPRRIGDVLLVALFYPVTLEVAQLIEERRDALNISRKNAFRFLKNRLWKTS